MPSSDAVGNCCRWHPVIGSTLPCRVGVTSSPGAAHALPPTPVCTPGPDSSFPSSLCRAWATEKQALVSSEELAGDIARAEGLLALHEELGREIKEYCLQAQNVQQEGQRLVDSGHCMSLEVRAWLRVWS